jgi:hypothetical protein
VLAAGSRPRIPDIRGLEEVAFLTTVIFSGCRDCESPFSAANEQRYSPLGSEQKSTVWLALSMAR